MHERVRVYTRPRCLFCQQVMDLLLQARIDFIAIEVIEREQQEELTAKHGASSFPIVLIDGRYVGGYAHILHLHSQGRLKEISSSAKSGESSALSSPPAPLPPSAQSSPPAARPSQRSVPSMISAMSQLQQALKDGEAKKR